MKPRSNRLPSTGPGVFSGSFIDRNKPLSFRLDGRLIFGFAGDTVLSAVLASGIDTLGTYGKWPIALTPDSAPVLSIPGRMADPANALPMERTPAIDGADLVTSGAQRGSPLSRLFQPGRTLGIDLTQPGALDRPWRRLPGAEQAGADIVVIGGGVAGMQAALAASAAGLAVTLVEVSPLLGGNSWLFGTQDGEDTPENDIARLRTAIEANAGIQVLLCSHAYAIRPGLVRVHRVEIVEDKARGSVLDLPTLMVVLATGAQEHLPIFSGNRMPGVMGTSHAYELARRYGIWPGQSALIATASNFAYRLAMLASDAGISVGRILDSRADASSRFIAFSRAYGMVQMPGARAAQVDVSRGALAVHSDQATAAPLHTERLLVCGGWQPDLTLWHAAGGASLWHPDRHRLEPSGTIDGITLAGSAAGYFTRQACIESGYDAINLLLARARKAVTDPMIDPLYESPDAPLPIAVPRDRAAPAFLGGGEKFLQRPAQHTRHWTDPFSRKRPQTGLRALSEAPQALAIGDVIAGVELGLIPSNAAGIVAQERLALVPLGAAPQAASPQDDTPEAQEIPSYLEGRFGEDARLVRIIPTEARELSSGALIYRSSDPAGPTRAIGVVLRWSGDIALALMHGEAAKAGLPVSVRDRGRAVSARLEICNEAD